ncbi:hypothetical protein WJX72_005713 [[Myrmecia] bisecta]|uniref:Uncharacterized protein n=1 Tax=[Myrmecia] bisecta TaxID=41462 RepID=A0AAW1QRW9_9CHLO
MNCINIAGAALLAHTALADGKRQVALWNAVSGVKALAALALMCWRFDTYSQWREPLYAMLRVSWVADMVIARTAIRSPLQAGCSVPHLLLSIFFFGGVVGLALPAFQPNRKDGDQLTAQAGTWATCQLGDAGILRRVRGVPCEVLLFYLQVVLGCVFPTLVVWDCNRKLKEGFERLEGSPLHAEGSQIGHISAQARRRSLGGASSAVWDQGPHSTATESMESLPSVAERLAACFASARVDGQTAQALAALFPDARLISLSVLAGGKLLITADNLVKEGCMRVSFLRLDSTASGAAMLHHNSCHVIPRTLRYGRYMDAHYAINQRGCTSFTSVPILSGVPTTADGGPLVQAGLAALGALSVGSCGIVSGRQLTQLMTLACLTSPFISSYISGMVQDLTSIFLAPSLASCICGCGQPICARREQSVKNATGKPGSPPGRRSQCREDDDSDSDSEHGSQALWTSEDEADVPFEDVMAPPPPGPTYAQWHAGQQSKIDTLFAVVVGCVLCVFLFKPYKLLDYMWPATLAFMLPCIARAASPGWYLKHREAAMAVAYIGEVRLPTFIAMQLIAWAVMVLNIPRVAPTVLASTGLVPTWVLVLTATASAMIPIPIIYASDKRLRREFLSRLFAPTA